MCISVHSVLFGFLHCPDICPTSLAELSRLAHDLHPRRPRPAAPGHDAPARGDLELPALVPGRRLHELHRRGVDHVPVGRPFPPLTEWCRISTGTLEEVEVFTKTLLKVMG